MSRSWDGGVEESKKGGPERAWEEAEPSAAEAATAEVPLGGDGDVSGCVCERERELQMNGGQTPL